MALSQITKYAEALGLTVEVASIASAADLPQATASLADKGVEILMIGAGYTESSGIPAILGAASDYGIPVFGVSPRMIYHGAVVGAGFYDFYGEGVTVGRMIAAYINGTLDVSATGISSRVDLGVAVNLDTAEEFGITVADSILDSAVMVIEGGELNVLSEPPSLPEMTLEERMAEDAAFLAELECTPERIAEEQAAHWMPRKNRQHIPSNSIRNLGRGRLETIALFVFADDLMLLQFRLSYCDTRLDAGQCYM